MNSSIPTVASSLQRFLHAPPEHVSIMIGKDRSGDLLTVFVSKEWVDRLPSVPNPFKGVRVEGSEARKDRSVVGASSPLLASQERPYGHCPMAPLL